ncbi:MAG TPA: Na+/H+ antiporter NhaC family protein [Gemmatimonadaceae bacterium]|nr:Na+/H+ antiporter NhaC family protein [Gemmatimonadaceae bacterium]
MRLRFPHPLTLLVGFVVLAAVATYVLPAGQFDRRDDPATGRKVVVAGTYHHVPHTPVTPFQAVVAIPKGMAAAAPIIFLVFLIGGAFGVVDQTGALRRGVAWMVRRLERRELLAIPIICLVFGTAGALDNMHEEIIPLVPALLLLTTRLGFDNVVAAAVSVGAAGVGSAFSPINPFQVGIAQKLAGLPLLSGAGFRLIFLALALTLWILATMRYARATRSARVSEVREAEALLDRRDIVVLSTVLLTFAILVFGVTRLGWDFDQMSALFFVMGIVVGLIGRLGANRTGEAFVEGFRSMAFAAMLIGFARAIYVVAEEGQIIDTIVNGLFSPLSHFPLGFAVVGMMVTQFLIHFPVPSVTGHAVLTMPVLVPLSDLLGMQRQVTVLIYQYGGGLCNFLTPTNGGLMAILAAASVPYGKWIRFLAPIYAGLFLLGLIAIWIAFAIGLR